jgi:hypothetical protein
VIRIIIGPHDIALVAAVSLQATALSQAPEARWKAAILSLPVPFTMAALAVGRPVGATNVLALVLLFLFAQTVRVLHQQWRTPIVLSIALAAAGYILLGAALARLIPDTDLAFWTACAGVILLGAALLRTLPHRNEPAYRSPVTLLIKLPVIVAVILVLVTLKSVLQGFMTLFPMMGVVAAYEARHSLWTVGRQMPVVMITLAPMMAVCRISQGRVGLGPGLLLGWLAFLVVFLPLMRFDWKKADYRAAPSVTV